MSDSSGIDNNAYNISNLGPFGLHILVIIVLYLQNVVALAYIGTDNQFIPENDEFNSDDENAVQIEGESKQAAKFAPEEPKYQYELGLLFKDTGDYQSAIKAFELFVEKSSPDATELEDAKKEIADLKAMRKRR